MKIIPYSELKQSLYDFADDASYGMVFLGKKTDVGILSAIRNVARLCDVVVLVDLFPVESGRMRLNENLLNFIGVDLLSCSLDDGASNNSNGQGGVGYTVGIESFATQELNSKGVKITKCEVYTGIDGVDGTVILQNILAVMPNLVSCSENDIELLYALKNINQTFPDIFVLQDKETPLDMLTYLQKDLRKGLTPLIDILKSGERNWKVIRSVIEDEKSLQGIELLFCDGGSLELLSGGILPQKIYLLANQKGVKDSLLIH